MKITSGGVVECILDGSIIYAPVSLVITAGTWHMLTISFLVTAHGYQETLVVLDNLWNNLDQNSITTPTFLPTDVIQSGGPNGFLGKIAQFEIYNPGPPKFEGNIFRLFLYKINSSLFYHYM